MAWWYFFEEAWIDCFRKDLGRHIGWEASHSSRAVLKPRPPYSGSLYLAKNEGVVRNFPVIVALDVKVKNYECRSDTMVSRYVCLSKYGLDYSNNTSERGWNKLCRLLNSFCRHLGLETTIGGWESLLSRWDFSYSSERLMKVGTDEDIDISKLLDVLSSGKKHVDLNF